MLTGDVSLEEFAEIVARAVASLPEELAECLDNVDIVVADEPTGEQLESVGLEPDDDLLGLYEGVPITQRGAYYGLVTPDIITVFRRSILARCRNRRELVREIQDVVEHEIAHHFGIGDRRLEELENGNY